METKTEAIEKLVIVDAALSEYIQGKRRISLRIGTNEFYRARNYAEITYKELLEEKFRLQAIIDSYATTVPTPQFRSNTTFPLIVTKLPIN